MITNHTPIKRSPQLAHLSREHHGGLLFCWKINRGLGNGTDERVLREFTRWFWRHHLKPHFDQEEKLLLPYLNGHSLADQLKKEHEDIKDLVLAIDKEPARELFSILALFVSNHIRFEERHLFAYLEKTLPKEQLDIIGHELGDDEVCFDDWKLAFWSKG